MMTTSNGRRPQNIKSWMSQQPVIGPCSNFKLKLRWPNYIVYCTNSLIKTNSNGRWPPMEDDLQRKTTSNGRQPKGCPGNNAEFSNHIKGG